MKNYLVESTAGKDVPVGDLKIVVSRKTPQVITEDDKNRSVCLANLERMGKVRVSCVTLSKEEREAPKAPKKPSRNLVGSSPSLPVRSGMIIIPITPAPVAAVTEPKKVATKKSRKVGV